MERCSHSNNFSAWNLKHPLYWLNNGGVKNLKHYCIEMDMDVYIDGWKDKCDKHTLHNYV